MRKFLAIAGVVMAGSAAASAQPPSDLHTRLSEIKQVDTPLGLTRIPDAEGDGREMMVFHSWRENGNAWGYGVFMMTMTSRAHRDPYESAWDIVGIASEPKGGLKHEVTDQPHTGEDDLKVVRFVRAKLDGKVDTFLVTAIRNPPGAAPDPVVAEIRIYALRNHEDEEVGTTPDSFDPVFAFTTTKSCSDADDALLDELGLPLPKG